MENEEKNLMVQEEGSVQSFASYRTASNTEARTFTNITDKKKLFNLKTNVDYKINDCVGESIRVKDVVIKRWLKPLEEPVTLEDGTIKDFEISVSCVIVDDNGKSYATGSKRFTRDLISYLTECGGEAELKDGIEIKIINVATPNGNKALSFELI